MAYDKLTLEKGMIQEAGQKGLTLTQFLETQDPSGNYEDSALKGLDAFERQLKRFDIKMTSDPVAKFYATNESRILFPEYIDRMIREGLIKRSIINQIVAVRTKIDSNEYHSIYMDDSDPNRYELKRVSEGGKIPETEVKTKENIVKMYKSGRVLKITYEAAKRMKIPLMSKMLERVGIYMDKSDEKAAIDVIINGDGNNNSAPSYTIGTGDISGVAGTLSYDSILDFWAEFDPYDMNTILAPKKMMTDILKLPEFKDPQAGFNFQSTGRVMSPLGASLVRSDNVPTGKIIGMDRDLTLEMVEVMSPMTESDKLIDTQFERIVISRISGFAKWDGEAAKILNKQ